VNFATTSVDTHFRDNPRFPHGRPPREGLARESTSSLSLGAALGLILLYSAGLWAGIWLTVTRLLW
jgi:hypothetical protein